MQKSNIFPLSSLPLTGGKEGEGVVRFVMIEPKISPTSKDEDLREDLLDAFVG
jgi:hypothetical protein